MALLLVLCILLLMSGMVTVSSYYWLEIYYIAEKIKDSNSRRWLLLGAEEIFLQQMTGNLSDNKLMNNISLAIQASPNFMVINDNYINLSLVEQVNCFNINALRYFSINDKSFNTVYPWLVLKRILQLENIASMTLNDVEINDDDFLNVNYKINDIRVNALLSEILENNLFNVDRFISDKSSIFCSRNDDRLLININLLEVRQSKLVQAILLNIINEAVITRAILSRPVNGWSNVKEFFDFIFNYSNIDGEDMHKLRKIIVSNFSHDEYYFSSIFRSDGDNVSYQLISVFKVKDSQVSILERRYSVDE
ncbi:general secretion pathway protein K [Yersinia frederiksenii]|nr:general secretion pathway protein K [Yersinia frederiksenii]